MIEGRWFPQGADLSVPLRLRRAVFGRGEDALDAIAQQVVVFSAGIPVGAARLWWQDGGFHAGDVGVLTEERGRGYGDLLVRLILYKAATHGAKRLTLVCPAALLPFFARYGFAPEPGAEAGNTLTLSAPTDVSGGCHGCSGR